MSQKYLCAAREVAFNYLRKTNNLLIINDKEDSFFHCFNNKYKVCNTFLVGSDYGDIPWRAGYSVTSLDKYLKHAYEDDALNAPFDVVYLDLTSRVQIKEYLDNCIDDNTVLILKFKSISSASLPEELDKLNKDYYLIGSWHEEPTHESEYYMVLY